MIRARSLAMQNLLRPQMDNLMEMGRHLLASNTREEEGYEGRTLVHAEFLEQAYAALCALNASCELSDADIRELIVLIGSRPNRDDHSATRVWCMEVWNYMISDAFYYADKIVRKLRAALGSIFPDQLRTPTAGDGPCKCDMCGACISEHLEVREILRHEFIEQHLIQHLPVQFLQASLQRVRPTSPAPVTPRPTTEVVS